MKEQRVNIVIVLLVLLILTPVDVFAADDDGQGNHYQGPPPEALSACLGMQAGDTVVFPGENETITALCLEHNGQLIAVPEPMNQLDRRDRQRQSFSVVDTGQAACYDSNGIEIDCPPAEVAFYGQDAQFEGPGLNYTDNGDGTVTDNVTGLVWQQVPADMPFNWQDAQDYCEVLSLAGSDNWRTPSLKELFSISDFAIGWPYINTEYFGLANAPEFKQQQYWSSNYYEVGTTHGGASSAMGVNHGTGHIKAYPDGNDGGPMVAKYVRCVRGEEYGVNKFGDRHDGTVTDKATGLMWMQDDSFVALDWQEALAFAEQKNAENYMGYRDWRLPNIKELQSIVDYSGVYPAIDVRYFQMTDQDSYFWSSTSAYFGPQSPEYYYAWYVAFGYAVGDDGEDLHGAGAVRFDTKAVGGPEGEDPERIYNYVRLVRDTDKHSR